MESKKIAIDVLNGPAVTALNKKGIEVVDAKIADATGGEPIFSVDGAPIGRVTSGAYCAGVGKSLALVFIKSSIIDVEMHVMILGKPHLAKLLDEPPFDPKGLKLRS